MNTGNSAWTKEARYKQGDKSIVHTEQWYVYLHDAIGQDRIMEQRFPNKKHTSIVLYCEDERLRRLWLMTEHEAASFLKGVKNHLFDVTVYVKNGDGKPKKWVDPSDVTITQSRKRSWLDD